MAHGMRRNIFFSAAVSSLAVCCQQFTSIAIGAASTLEPLPAVSEEGYCGYYGNFYRVEEINKHVILYVRHFSIKIHSIFILYIFFEFFAASSLFTATGERN